MPVFMPLAMTIEQCLIRFAEDSAMMNEAAISWSSKKQATIALSSCEAEIVAGSEASKEAISLAGLASELGLHDGSPIDLHAVC